jgi:hypothetical protein
MMVTSKIDPLDPEAVLSIKDKLGLSQQQIAKLEDIAYKSRQQSKSVLNAQQAQTIDELQSQPKTLMKMQENLMNTVMNTMKSHQKIGRSPDCNGPAGHRDICEIKDANSAGIRKAVSKAH